MGLYNNTAETERLLTENYERYYRLAFKLMRNQDDALDVVQESAYLMWKRYVFLGIAADSGGKPLQDIVYVRFLASTSVAI